MTSEDDPTGLPSGENMPDEAPFVYANVVQMNVGPYDFTMDFAYQAPENRQVAEETGQPAAFQRVVRVAMSHAHAKSMIPLLAKLIANLEAQAGTIPTIGFEKKSKE